MGKTLHPHHNNALLTGAPGPLMMSAARGDCGGIGGKSTPEEAAASSPGPLHSLMLDRHVWAPCPGAPQTLSPRVINSTSVGTCSAFAVLLAISSLKALT